MDKVSLVKRTNQREIEKPSEFSIKLDPAPMREVVAYYIHNDDIRKDMLHDGFRDGLYINRLSQKMAQK